MNEAQFCTIIVNSAENGTLYKIPDASGNYSATSKRCCDIIGSLYKNNKFVPVYIEAKFNKEMSAFSLKRIEDHQAAHLSEWNKIENAQCYIILGVKAKRADTRAYIFEWSCLAPLYKNGFSIHKKYLEKLPYNKVSKQLFTWDNIINNNIMKEVYQEDIYEKFNI